MANQSISAHVVVTSQTPGKLSESKANNPSNAESSTGFANILAAQIQGEAATAGIPALPNTDEAPLNTTEKPVKDTDIAALTADAETAKQLADSQNTQSAAYLQGVQLEVHVQVQSQAQTQTQVQVGGKADALTLDSNIAAKPLSADTAIAAKPDLEKAAKEIAEPAKLAAGDKTLPLDSLHEAKAEPVNTFAANQVQANRASTPLQANATPVQAVEVPVGHAGWDDAFSQRVAWVANNTQQIAQLHLNPPNLGPVEIRITLNSDQANATFTSPHAAVREAIEAAVPRLRDMLADNGLSLGNVNVSSQSFQQQQQQQQQTNGGGGGGQRYDPFQELQRAAASDRLLGSTVQGGIASVQVNKGLVDIFA